jgi:hypothetical protein
LLLLACGGALDDDLTSVVVVVVVVVVVDAVDNGGDGVASAATLRSLSDCEALRCSCGCDGASSDDEVDDLASLRACCCDECRCNASASPLFVDDVDLLTTTHHTQHHTTDTANRKSKQIETQRRWMCARTNRRRCEEDDDDAWRCGASLSLPSVGV